MRGQLTEIIEFSQQEFLRIQAVQAANAQPPPPAGNQPAAPAIAAAAEPVAAAAPAGEPDAAAAPAAIPPAPAMPTGLPQLMNRPGNQPAFQMVADQADIDQADAAKRDTRADAKKVTLPELVSGTKASSLNLRE